jgi:tRNA U55 pseudouridine synthase TruB
VEVEVSSGTYIRTLFEDFCQYFGTFGHLEELIRSQIGHNDLSTGWSLNLNDWEHLKSTENWDRYSIALDAVVPLPTLDLCQELAQKVIFGQPLPIETIKSGHREHTEEQLYWAKLERQPFGLLRQSEGLVKSTAVLFRPF